MLSNPSINDVCVFCQDRPGIDSSLCCSHYFPDIPRSYSRFKARSAPTASARAHHDPDSSEHTNQSPRLALFSVSWVPEKRTERIRPHSTHLRLLLRSNRCDPFVPRTALAGFPPKNKKMWWLRRRSRGGLAPSVSTTDDAPPALDQERYDMRRLMADEYDEEVRILLDGAAINHETADDPRDPHLHRTRPHSDDEMTAPAPLLPSSSPHQDYDISRLSNFLVEWHRRREPEQPTPQVSAAASRLRDLFFGLNQQYFDSLSLQQPQEPSSSETLLLSGTVILQLQESSSEQQVAAYAVFPDEETEELLALGLTCPICLVDYVDGEEIQCPQRCHHAFHVHCLAQWLAFSSRQQVCPCCRARIGSTTNPPPAGRNSVISPGVMAHVPPPRSSPSQDSVYLEDDDDDDNDVASDAAVATNRRRRRLSRPPSTETAPTIPGLHPDFGYPMDAEQQQRRRRRRTGTPPPIVAPRHDGGEGQSHDNDEQPSNSQEDGRWSERTASPRGGIISGQEETSVRAERNHHSPEQQQHTHTASSSEELVRGGSEDDDDYDVPSDDTVVSGLRPSSLHHDGRTDTPFFFPEHTTTQPIVTLSEHTESPLGGVDSGGETVLAGSIHSPEQQQHTAFPSQLQDNSDDAEQCDEDDAMVMSLEQSWHHHQRTETPPPRYQILEDAQLITPPPLRQDEEQNVGQTHDGMLHDMHTPEQQQSMLEEYAPPPPPPPLIPRLWGGIHTAAESAAARYQFSEQRSQIRPRGREAPPSPLRLWGGIHPTP